MGIKIREILFNLPPSSSFLMFIIHLTLSEAELFVVFLCVGNLWSTWLTQQMPHSQSGSCYWGSRIKLSLMITNHHRAEATPALRGVHFHVQREFRRGSNNMSSNQIIIASQTNNQNDWVAMILLRNRKRSRSMQRESLAMKILINPWLDMKLLVVIEKMRRVVVARQLY